MITDRQKWHVSVGSRVLGERCHQPAGAAEVLEAVLIAPELRARCHAAHLAEGVGKVRVNLDHVEKLGVLISTKAALMARR